MYFAKIESSRAANAAYNNGLRVAAARRLGDMQRESFAGSAKRASMAWNIENKWANGAAKGTINRKAAAKLQRRVDEWDKGNGKSKADHKHHKPGSYNK